MPPRKSTTLTTAELRLMKILWDLGQGTVNDVVQALPDDDQLLELVCGIARDVTLWDDLRTVLLDP